MKKNIEADRVQEMSEDLGIKFEEIKRAMDYYKKNKSLLDSLQEDEEKETKYTTTELGTVPLSHAE